MRRIIQSPECKLNPKYTPNSIKLLEGRLRLVTAVRAAGSWKRYVRAPHIKLVVLRCPVPLTVRGTQTLVSFAPLALPHECRDGDSVFRPFRVTVIVIRACVLGRGWHRTPAEPGSLVHDGSSPFAVSAECFGELDPGGTGDRGVPGVAQAACKRPGCDPRRRVSPDVCA